LAYAEIIFLVLTVAKMQQQLKDC